MGAILQYFGECKKWVQYFNNLENANISGCNIAIFWGMQILVGATLVETKVNMILDCNFTEGLFSTNFPAAMFALKEL